MDADWTRRRGGARIQYVVYGVGGQCVVPARPMFS
jgi:hypothetical protein